MQVVTPIASDRKRVLKLLCIGFGALLAMASPKKSGTAGLRTLLVCLLVVLSFPVTRAQTTGSGSIQGTVTDPSGAVIRNASVTLVETSTQVTRTAKTSSGGDYAFPNINVGTYSVTITAPGFETYLSTGNVLEVGSSIAVDAKMTLGSADIKVEVRSQGMALQTEDASFKQTVDATEITEIPINGRTMTSLVSLVGGTQSAVPGDANGSKYPTQTTGFSIAGAQGNAITYRLDGGDNNDYMGGGNGPLPFPDAIGQFSVQTAAMGAQDGSQAGGLINMVTKSGTNTYHGSAFEFMRNNFIDATNFFSTSKDTLHQNQYGGTFGGPVRIPKLFDGRNKLFVFAGFQHTYSRSSSATQNAYEPTAANLAGDWSTTDPAPVSSGGTGVKNACGPVVQLYDPITGQLLPGNKYNQPGGPALPAWNASALALLKQLPPINPALDPNNCGHVSYAIPSISSDNDFDTRVDYTISSKNNMYARYFLDSNQVPTFYSPTNIYLTTQSGNPEIRWQSITIGETYIFSSSLVNTVHVTAVRRQLSRGFNPATPNATAFGIKDFQTVPSGIWINCGTSGANHCNTIGSGSNLLAVINDNIPVDIADDVTLVRGKHQIGFGGSYVRNQLNVNNGYEANGDFTFNGNWSGQTKPGDANLDFLQGALSGFSQSKAQQNALRGSMPTLYVQDTYHPVPRLTLTGGIRWLPLYFPHDYFHRGTVFNMAAFLADQHSTVYPNAPAGTFYYGDPGVKPAFTGNTPLEFNPNFALAYDVFGDGKTIFRAGTAYAYNMPNFFVQQRVQQDPPFSALVSPNTAAELCFSDPWLVGGTGNAGCGQTGGNDTFPASILPGTPTPANAVFSQQSQYIVLQPTYKMPNTMQWTASIQQAFARGWTVQFFYTGNRTQDQLVGIPLNPAVYTPGVWGPGGTGCGPVVTTGPAAVASHTVGGGVVGAPCSVNGTNQNTSKGIYNNTQARYALTEANPTQGNYYSGGSGGSLIESNSAYGNYNGLTVTVQHRFSSTFNFQTNYTWSKCLNNADPQGDLSGTQFSNPNNPALDYGRCGSDIRHNFNTTIVVKSNFPLKGISRYILNNWELGGLFRLVSGTPFTVTENQDESFTANGGDRPNLVPGVPIYNYTKILSDPGGATYATRSYLNQAAFVLNTVPGTQGNISRNSFSNPIYFQNDAQITRIFPLHSRLDLYLRLEAFNVLNHPSFSSGNNSGPSFTGNFGEITSTSVGGRVFQGVIKVLF
ncbi:carboxypeptidase-like regulatory domain-containing protein [Granulicella sp. L46]|uniref:TonB-dependent receptor n=1 Tax=Granulicella sp. L46 TaxID=1641865 RepID=UPI00131E5EDE|nr:carboxypeptidase-like regulatory domain-containing protein [Granulicella sp. L46]